MLQTEPGDVMEQETFGAHRACSVIEREASVTGNHWDSGVACYSSNV